MPKFDIGCRYMIKFDWMDCEDDPESVSETDKGIQIVAYSTISGEYEVCPEKPEDLGFKNRDMRQ